MILIQIYTRTYVHLILLTMTSIIRRWPRSTVAATSESGIYIIIYNVCIYIYIYAYMYVYACIHIYIYI